MVLQSRRALMDTTANFVPEVRIFPSIEILQLITHERTHIFIESILQP